MVTLHNTSSHSWFSPEANRKICSGSVIVIIALGALVSLGGAFLGESLKTSIRANLILPGLILFAAGCCGLCVSVLGVSLSVFLCPPTQPRSSAAIEL